MKLIGLSSSRKPPNRVRQLINELAFIVPNSTKIQRGHMNTVDLGLTAYNKGISHLLLVTSNHGNPGLLSGYEINVVNETLNLKWCFDCEIKWVKLAQDLKVNRLNKKVVDIKFTQLGIHSDISKVLNQFFDNSRPQKEYQNELILEHKDPGFLFYPKVKQQEYSPTLFFSKIILPDKPINSEN